MKRYRYLTVWLMLLVCLTVGGGEIFSWKNDNILNEIIDAKQEKLEKLTFSKLKFLTEFGFVDRNQKWLEMYENSLSPSTRQQMKQQQRAITILATKLASIESRFRVNLQETVTEQLISQVNYISTPPNLDEIKEKMKKEGVGFYCIVVLPDELAMAKRIVGVLSAFQNIAEQNNYFGLEYLFIKDRYAIEKIGISKSIITIEPKWTNEQLYSIIISSVLKSTTGNGEKIFIIEESQQTSGKK